MPVVHGTKPPAGSAPKAASPQAAPAKKTPAKPAVGAGTDQFDVHSARAAAVLEVAPTPKDVSIPGIREIFPLQDLGQIDGRGLVGDLFLLDGGAVDNMKVQVRRVREGGEPGFEVNFRLQKDALTKLIAAAKKAGGKAGPLEFVARTVGADGRLEKGSKTGEVTASSSYAPDHMSQDEGSWTTRLSGQKGGHITIASDRAAPSAAGLVRIHLLGDDATCTKQLDGLLKSLGLAHVFAPPTDATKRRFMLMRALWQNDHKQAKKLGSSSGGALAAVEKVAASAGVSAARAKALRLTDVSPTHFTVIDPAQAKAMIDAGARYLYSTVEKAEHIADILERGQKSSLRRYLDGFIFDGMSTNEDFCSGGGVGVFTRLVSESAILDGESWTGRRYKVILRPEVLARTDWYGHPGDEFGRAHGLDQSNFGVKLLEEIGNEEGNYQSDNELIFRDSIGPQYIGHIVATSESDRAALLEVLKKRGVKPVNGKSLEDLVLLAPRFMFYGPSPYDDRPPGELAQEALAEAKKNKMHKARWFLAAGPDGPEKAKLEVELLRVDDHDVRELALDAIAARGRFAHGASELGALLAAPASSKKGSKDDLLDELARRVPAALLASNLDAAAQLLRERGAKGTSWSGPLGIQDGAWAGVFELLAPAQKKGEPKSECLELALELAAARLLDKKDPGFLAFLGRYPFVQPPDPKAYVAHELGKKNISVEFRCFVAQAKSPEVQAATELALLQADSSRSAELLSVALARDGRFALEPQALAAAVKKLSADGPVRKQLLTGVQLPLIRSGEPSLLALLEERWKKSPQSMKPGFGEWPQLLEGHLKNGKPIDSPALRWLLRHGLASLLSNDVEGASVSLRSALAGLPGLFEAKKPSAFVSQAVSKLQEAGSDATLRLAWALSGGAELREAAVEGLLRSGKKEAEELLEWSIRREPARRLPISKEKLSELAELLGPELAKGQHKTADWFFRNQASHLIAAAGPAAVAVVKALVEKKGDHYLGLSYGKWIEPLKALATAKHPGAKEARVWLIERYAKGALSNDPPSGAFELFETLKVTPQMLGLDDAAAAEKARSLAEDYVYELDDGYDDEAVNKPIPEAVLWLLHDADGAVHEGRFKELMKGIVDAEGGGWNTPEWPRFLDALAEVLPAEYKKPIMATKKKVKSA